MSQPTWVPVSDVRAGDVVSVLIGSGYLPVVSCVKTTHNGKPCHLLIQGEGDPSKQVRHEYFLGSEHWVLKVER